MKEVLGKEEAGILSTHTERCVFFFFFPLLL